MSYSGPTVVQVVSFGYSNLAGGTTQLPAFGSTTVAGNSILVGFEFYSTTTLSGATVFDSAGNTYSLVGFQANSSGGLSLCALYRADGISAVASVKVSVTSPSGAPFGGAYAIETTPLGPVDQFGGIVQNGSGTFGPTVTTLLDNELCIGWSGDSGGFTWAVGTSVAWIQAGTGNTGGIMQYFEQATAGSIQSDMNVSGGTGNNSSLIATFPVASTSSVFGSATFMVTSGTPGTTSSFNTNVGDLIYVDAAGFGSQTMSVTDSAGNTYSPVSAQLLTSGGIEVGGFYTIATIPSATNVVSVASTGTLRQCGVLYVPVANGGTIVFDAGNSTTFSSSTSSFQSTAVTTGGFDELIVLSMANDGASTATGPAGYTSHANFDGNSVSSLFYKRLAEPVNGYAPAATFGGSSTGGMFLGAFKGIPASIFGTPQFSGTGARTVPSLASNSLNTTLGDLIIVAVGSSDSDIATVTDSAGNTYTPLTVRNNFSVGFLQWWYCNGVTSASGTNVVTATATTPPSTNNYITMAVWDVPLSSTASYDTDSDIGTARSGQTATFTTTGTDEFIAAFALDAFGSNGYSTEPGWTNNGSFGQFSGAAYSRFFSPITGIQTVFSSTPNTSVVFALAFKGGSAPPPPGPGGPVVVCIMT